MRLVSFCLLSMLCLSLSVSPLQAEETHPFSVNDMLAMERISDPQVSPDDSQIVFTLRTTDLEADKGRTDLWLVGADGSDLRRLTTNESADFNPRWAPDGKAIYFLSTRSESSQVWRIRIDGGEAEQITDLNLDAGNLIVSPDGKHIAVTMEVFPGKTPLETKEKLDEIAERKATGRIYERIFVRHWDTWKDGRRSHLFVIPATGGEAIDVMPAMDADTPSKPFGGPEEITFTPDGKGVVFSARDVGAEEPWSTNFDLFYAPITGTEPPKSLTAKNEAWDTNPVFSPDGKTLAYLAMKRPGYESDRLRIVLQSWPKGKKRVLTEKWDRSPSSI
ncbi:MAG: TolB family protein, partial [Planctomycetota bacterium]